MIRLRPLILALVALLGPPPASAQEKTPSRDEIEQIVRQYLLEHPEILIEMSQRLRERQEAARRLETAGAIETNREALAGEAAMAMGAAAGAPGVVTVVEFFDYRCGYCKRVVPTLQRLLAQDPALRIVLQELPILGPESVEASKAALAAKPQGKYLAVHQALMQATDLSSAGIERTVRAAGVDWGKWQQEFRSAGVQAAIERSRALAAALSVEATPAFLIGGEVVPGALSEAMFQERIAKARAAQLEPAAGKP